MDLKKKIRDSKFALAMIATQIISSGLLLLSRLVLQTGISIFALLFYRSIVGAICVAIIGFYFDRNMMFPISKASAIGWTFLGGLFGITVPLSLFYMGLKATNATYATMFINMIPIATLTLSIISRSEQFTFQSRSGKMKIGGAAACVAGTFFYSLVRGSVFQLRPHHVPDLLQVDMGIDADTYDWVHGTFLLAACAVGSAIFFLLQTQISNVYPSKYWSTTLTCTMGAIQSALIGLTLDRDITAWRLGWNLQLGTIVYSGALGTGASFCLMQWTAKNKGPTYPSLFNPICLVVVAITEAIFFESVVSIGNITGIFLICFGSFAISWGKKISTADHAEIPPTETVETV